MCTAADTTEEADSAQHIHVAQANASSLELLLFRTGDRTDVSRVLHSSAVHLAACLRPRKLHPGCQHALQYEVKAREVVSVLHAQTQC